MLVLLVGTAFLYMWNLAASGYANTFYAAAVQAGTQSWKALLFGSLDAGNSITVDKPPAALWLDALSGRVFGFSSWSMLIPQALCGVAAVALLYAAVRRWSGPVAGLIAGAALALTPVAVLMFRFNNPDALLTLLMVAAAYCVVRALEKVSSRAAMLWLMVAGAAIGFGFLTKMMQAFLVLPAFVLVYLVVSRFSWPRRLLHLLAAGGTLLVSAGWFVALVELWPAASRPYIGGSTNNSLLELALGYNGLGRIFGQGGGAGGFGGGGGAGGGGGGFGGATGITRLFSDSFGSEISWLLPAALIGMVTVLWVGRRAPRTDRTRAAVLLWGGWLLVTGLVFSYMSGIIHPYYTVALAPAIGALIGISSVTLWRSRTEIAPRVALAAMVAVTGIWAYDLLGRDSSWLPALRWIVVIAGVLAATGLLVGAHRTRRIAVIAAIAAVMTGFGGASAYAVATASVPHNGSIPTSGPASAGGQGGFGGGPSGGMIIREGGRPNFGGGQPGSGGQRGFDGQPPTSGTSRPGNQSGGPGGDATANSQLTALVKATSTMWAAATNGSQGAASLELASGKSVMAIGGFSGTDNSPTLAQFQQYVAQGKISYYIGGGQQGRGGDGSGTAIATWVAAHYTAKTVGGQTVYDLRS
ncbi:ArnT family glycosyltransferase [Fodinicola feengrottensis]